MKRLSLSFLLLCVSLTASQATAQRRTVPSTPEPRRVSTTNTNVDTVANIAQPRENTDESREMTLLESAKKVSELEGQLARNRVQHPTYNGLVNDIRGMQREIAALQQRDRSKPRGSGATPQGTLAKMERLGKEVEGFIDNRDQLIATQREKMIRLREEITRRMGSIVGGQGTMANPRDAVSPKDATPAKPRPLRRNR